jgi:hypothetical protein
MDCGDLTSPTASVTVADQPSSHGAASRRHAIGAQRPTLRMPSLVVKSLARIARPDRRPAKSRLF